jgi:hypothetical protein
MNSLQDGLDASVRERFSRFAMLTQAKSQLEDKLEQTKEQLEALNEELLLEMSRMGMNSVKLTGIGNFSPRTDTYASVPQEARLEAFGWLRQQPDGADLIQETVNSQTLRSWFLDLRRQMPEDEAEEFERSATEHGVRVSRKSRLQFKKI